MGINAAGGADMRDEELYARYLKTNNTDDLKGRFGGRHDGRLCGGGIGNIEVLREEQL